MISIKVSSVQTNQTYQTNRLNQDYKAKIKEAKIKGINLILCQEEAGQGPRLTMLFSSNISQICRTLVRTQITIKIRWMDSSQASKYNNQM